MSRAHPEPPSSCSIDFGLHHDEWGQLVLTDAAGARHVGITPVRMFPFTEPTHWISLVNGAGKEVACVEDVTKLAPQAREVLEADLSRREFVPIITKIYSVSSILEPCEWDVETDRGRTKFVLKAEEDVRRLGENQAIILDASGIRYLVADLAGMNAVGRRALDRYV